MDTTYEEYKKFKELMSRKVQLKPGKVIRRYNIVAACLDQYFIPGESIYEYESAHSKQDLNAHVKYGTKLVKSGF